GVVADMLSHRQVESVEAMGNAAAGKIIIRDIPGLDISATQVRQRCASGRSVRYLVPDSVATIIDEEGLYRDEE
ncbi:MAG: nicotinic acid mononucleotide adenylyltransferase, partial [Gammaproteobacteria bacterium]